MSYSIDSKCGSSMESIDILGCQTIVKDIYSDTDNMVNDGMDIQLSRRVLFCSNRIQSHTF